MAWTALVRKRFSLAAEVEATREEKDSILVSACSAVVETLPGAMTCGGDGLHGEGLRAKAQEAPDLEQMSAL